MSPSREPQDDVSTRGPKGDGRNVSLEPVAYEDKAVLRELLNLYLYDLSDLPSAHAPVRGRFEYRYLDHYWTEEGRHAFFIKIDREVAGFVLVNAQSETGVERSIAEFFVMKKFRLRGAGSAAAARLFEALPGSWEICTDSDNPAAPRFWSAVVESFIGDAFEKRPGINGWTGPMFLFDNGGAA